MKKFRMDRRRRLTPKGLDWRVAFALARALYEHDQLVRAVYLESKREWDDPDNILPEEIPSSSSMSAWMRNDLEFREYWHNHAGSL